MKLSYILSGKVSNERIHNLLEAISQKLHDNGACPYCGEEDYPVDKDGNEIEGPDVSMASEWRERHDDDCPVTKIEHYLMSQQQEA